MIPKKANIFLYLFYTVWPCILFVLSHDQYVVYVCTPLLYQNTISGLVMPYGNRDLGKHWLGNGLLPDGTKPLPKPVLTYHQ